MHVNTRTKIEKRSVGGRLRFRRKQNNKAQFTEKGGQIKLVGGSIQRRLSENYPSTVFLNNNAK